MSKLFSSHGNTMTMSEFIELEVDERGNYEPEMIDEWMKKYYKLLKISFN